MSNLTTKSWTLPVQAYFSGLKFKFRWQRMVQLLAELLVVLSLSFLSYFLISRFVLQSVSVSGPSMLPNLVNHGSYFVNRLAYVTHDPERTDVVETRDPQDGTLVVKRIIGLPGESLYFKHGKVFVNGHPLSEPYLSPGMPTYAYEKNEDEFICVGANQYYVLGDNRNNSTDSRSFGPVSRDDILGKIIH